MNITVTPTLLDLFGWEVRINGIVVYTFWRKKSALELAYNLSKIYKNTCASEVIRRF